MVIKKNILFSIFLILFISCSHLTTTNISYDYNLLNKSINFRNGKWLITNQKIINDDNEGKFENHPFFALIPNGRFKEIEKLKNKRHKYIHPFSINSEPSKNDLKSIYSLTNYDYLIVPSYKDKFSKTPKQHLARVSFDEKRINSLQINIKIYQLNYQKLIYNLTCCATEISKPEGGIISTFTPQYIANKIFKEIKKHTSK